MKAAIFHGPHADLTIEDVEIDKPMPREVLVRTVASGVCHSDLHFVDGLYPMPAPAIQPSRKACRSASSSIVPPLNLDDEQSGASQIDCCE